MKEFFTNIGNFFDKVVEFFQNTIQTGKDAFATLSGVAENVKDFLAAFPAVAVFFGAALALVLVWIILSLTRDFL